MRTRLLPFLLVALSPAVASATGTSDLAADRVRAYENAYAAAHWAGAEGGAGIPSFSRQTGLACSACHSVFPQLNAFGRLFKLNGYTMTGLQTISEGGDSASRQSLRLNLIPPVSAMVQTSFTHVGKALPGTQNDNVAFPQELSLFFGEAITPTIGTFIQVTYEPGTGTIGLDNTDVRFATHTRLASKDAIIGFSLNNNPTVQDVWNSTPVWGYPYTSSGTAPEPTAGPLIAGGLGQQAAGLSAYALWNGLLYGEIGGYRTALQGGANPPDASTTGTIHALAPYWRLALQHFFGANAQQYVELGTYGIHASRYTAGVTGPMDRYTDIAVDAQYERPVGAGHLTAHATWIHEQQDLDGAFGAGAAANTSNTLNTVRADAALYAASRVGLSMGVFSTTGTADTLLYAPGSVAGSATGQPNSNGALAEFTFFPWLNTRFALQYVLYGKFNGGTTDYDGAGRDASHNNTLYLNAWFMF